MGDKRKAAVAAPGTPGTSTRQEAEGSYKRLRAEADLLARQLAQKKAEVDAHPHSRVVARAAFAKRLAPVVRYDAKQLLSSTMMWSSLAHLSARIVDLKNNDFTLDPALDEYNTVVDLGESWYCAYGYYYGSLAAVAAKRPGGVPHCDDDTSGNETEEDEEEDDGDGEVETGDSNDGGDGSSSSDSGGAGGGGSGSSTRGAGSITSAAAPTRVSDSQPAALKRDDPNEGGDDEGADHVIQLPLAATAEIEEKGVARRSGEGVALDEKTVASKSSAQRPAVFYKVALYWSSDLGVKNARLLLERPGGLPKEEMLATAELADAEDTTAHIRAMSVEQPARWSRGAIEATSFALAAFYRYQNCNSAKCI